jgi:hypothetical protein
MHRTLLGLACLAALPAHGRSPGEVQVTGIEHQVAKDRVRVVLRCDAPVEYVGGSASNPSRIFFDLRGTRPGAALALQSTVGDAILQRIRVGQNQPGITRVVLDLSQPAPYTATFLTNPPRLVVEIVRGGASPEARTLAKPSRQPPLSHKVKVKASPPTPAPSAPPPAPVALNPEQMPPAPPQVTYQNGLLTIVADNSTLSDILHAVAARTGATIDAPPNLTGQRVAARLGPGAPQDVMADLLSGLDYIVVGASNDPNAIRSIIVSPNSGSAPPSGMSAAQVLPPPPTEPSETAEPEPAPQPEAQAQPPGEPGGKTPPQVKSPEQLLEELRKLQEQQTKETGR